MKPHAHQNPSTPLKPLTQRTQPTPANNARESAQPERSTDRLTWKSILIHPATFEALKLVQQAQPHPRFDLAGLATAAIGAQLDAVAATELIHARAMQDFTTHKSHSTDNSTGATLQVEPS